MSDERLRYGAAACQVDFGNPADRSGIKAHVDRMLGMIDSAVIGYAPFLPVKLVVSSGFFPPDSFLPKRGAPPFFHEPAPEEPFPTFGTANPRGGNEHPDPRHDHSQG